MPRKKATKSRVSRINSRTIRLSEKLENDFRTLPTKLPALFNKDLNGLKKQENKLQSSLLKMQKQQAAAKNKHDSLTLKSKNNLTIAAKKQINAAKKVLEQLNKASLQCAAQLNDVKQYGKMLSQKQAKFSAICKYIETLDKEWERKNAKASKTKPSKVINSTKVKVSSRKKTKEKSKEEIAGILNHVESANTELETVEASS